MNRNKMRPSLLFALIAAGGAAIGLSMANAALGAESRAVTSQSDPQTLLFVQTVPEGATVRLGGKELGKTNMIYAVEPGSYKIVIDLSGHEPREEQVTVKQGRITRVEWTFDGQAGQQAASRRNPQVVATNPPTGATDVDPDLQYITVVFDQDMAGGYSFTGHGPNFPAAPQGKGPVWKDRRTCVLPVDLKRGYLYRVGINSRSYQNFRSVSGMPAQPSALSFTTKGASTRLQNQVRVPQIVSITPENGAKDVDPDVREIRVTFDITMGGGSSWTGGGPKFPEIPQGQMPTWSSDKKTCILPVRLKPDWDYVLGLNSASFQNFRSHWTVPLKPVIYQFSTKSN